MPRYTEDAYTGCPFYLKESANRLICEGIPEGSVNVTIFGASVGKARYKERFCRSNYNSCALCSALMDKY